MYLDNQKYTTEIEVIRGVQLSSQPGLVGYREESGCRDVADC